MKHWDNLDAVNADGEIKDDTLRLSFKKDAHGFKLSAMFSNRIYYYPDNDFNMDMKIIPSGQWVIDKIIEGENKIVTLKK